MSIATKRGDGGQTGLPGGVRVSKSDARVECYGTIDELISQMGFARSITKNEEVHNLVKDIQRELFKVGSAIGTAPGSRKPAPDITVEMVDSLEAHVIGLRRCRAFWAIGPFPAKFPIPPRWMWRVLCAAVWSVWLSGCLRKAC